MPRPPVVLTVKKLGITRFARIMNDKIEEARLSPK